MVTRGYLRRFKLYGCGATWRENGLPHNAGFGEIFFIQISIKKMHCSHEKIFWNSQSTASNKPLRHNLANLDEGLKNGGEFYAGKSF